jgi:hypothetical protein
MLLRLMRIAGGPRVLLLAFAARRPLAEGGPQKAPEGAAPKGRESTMNASPAAADLHDILGLVASSTIVLDDPAPRSEWVFSDWETQRRSDDVDALILAWIASHVPGTAQRGRPH